MLKFEPGTLVRSLAGHDKGKLYIIIEERYPMLLLADGALRTMAVSYTHLTLPTKA